MTKWDRFDGAVQRAHDDFEFRDVAVINYTGGYDESDGSVEWTPDSSPSSYPMEVVDPSEMSNPTTDAAGEEVDVDRIFRPRKDIDSSYGMGGYGSGGYGQTIKPMGEADDHATTLRIVDSGEEFDVVNVFDEENGLLQIQTVSR